MTGEDVAEDRSATHYLDRRESIPCCRVWSGGVISEGKTMAQQTAGPQIQPKSIVLFSDGTGNSSAKLFKTNVWRMYEAVDLGPSPADKRDQISFYDDGVGTSGFKLLAALGGAFGWGLKRNVLDLYRYACRNFRDGDQIYAFGFSRGAFTIRVVIALITSQGLVTSNDDSELDWNSRCAYRAFRSAFTAYKVGWLTRKIRARRDRWYERSNAHREAPYRPEDNRKPDIRFVGVWDTVAAYGGPIAEITRAIDNWFYPLSMPDYRLDEQVKCARHALAIDDERDAFQPLLWDELEESRRANEAKGAQRAAVEMAKPLRGKPERKAILAEAAKHAVRKHFFNKRIRQVWFTGMHADVGGGYPDESLSYVSLLWMMEEAEKEGLRTLGAIKDRFFALANSYGPMHDSRSGIAAYYRYQPRKIAAWLQPPDDRYLMLRDPDIQDPLGNEQGLLCRVRVHESVIARINTGTVRYAPIALPQDFDIIPPQLEGENVPQAYGAKGEAAPQEDGDPNLDDRQVRTRMQALVGSSICARLGQQAAERFAAQENLWNLVWQRRIAYFITVAVTMMIVLLPVWNPLSSINRACSDSRCVLAPIIRSGKLVVPGFAEPWVEAMARFPITALVLVAAVYGLLRWSQSAETKLRDGSYRLWRTVLEGRAIDPDHYRASRLRSFREGRPYQAFFRWLKWHGAPGFFSVLILAALLYAPTVAIAQLAIQVDESDHHFCPADPKVLRPIESESFIFDTKLRCVAPGLTIQKGQVYDVIFELPLSSQGDPVGFRDGRIPSEPGALTRVRASTVYQLLGMPMRRVIDASYLQPLAQTTRLGSLHRYAGEPDWLYNWRSQFTRVHITRLDLDQDADWPELYRGRIRAREDSSLHLFANDTHLPVIGHWFYDNNCGIARVTITRIVPRRRGEPRQQLMEEPGPVPLAPPACAQPAVTRQQGAQAL